MFEKFLVMYQIRLDPPKSPLIKGTSIRVPPFLRGVRGDLNAMRQLSKTCVYTVALLRGLGGINKRLKSQPTTFQTTS
jgi:hypothetical protein